MPMRSARCVAYASLASSAAQSANNDAFNDSNDTFPSKLCLPLARGGHSMRQRWSIFVALLLCAPALAGVKRPGSGPFDAQQSAALFVGVRTFAYGKLTDVPYAIDDAVDLAYEF